MQKNLPEGEYLANLIKESGHKGLNMLLDEESYFVERIDLTPRKYYKFSAVMYTKSGHEQWGHRYEIGVHLEDSEYITLLAELLSDRTLTFNRLINVAPAIYSKISAQLSSRKEDHTILDMPFVVYMDELEKDAEEIMGPQLYSVCLHEPLDGYEETVRMKIAGEKACLESTFAEDKGIYSSETIRKLDGISVARLMKCLDVHSPEMLCFSLQKRFYSYGAFEMVRTFLDENEIPYTDSKREEASDGF